MQYVRTRFNSSAAQQTSRLKQNPILPDPARPLRHLLMDLSLVEQLHTQLDQVKEQAISWEAKEAAAKKNSEAMMNLSEQNAEALDSKIILDVGGTLFSTTKDTLMRAKDSYVANLLLSGHWQPQKDGTYFIDRDPYFFRLILKYIQCNLLDTSGLSEIQKQMLQIEFDHFFPNVKVEDMAVVDTTANLCSNYLNTLKGWIGDHFDASKLLWRGSRDGFTAQAFHSRCDNQGATLTVIKSGNDWIFGGFNPSHWSSGITYSIGTGSFLFTLTNPNGIPPTQYFCHNPVTAAYKNATYGPIFGGGHDLTVFASGYGGGGTWSSFTSFPYSYTDTTGFGSATFTGKKEFDVKEIEVYAIS